MSREKQFSVRTIPCVTVSRLPLPHIRVNTYSIFLLFSAFGRSAFDRNRLFGLGNGQASTDLPGEIVGYFTVPRNCLNPSRCGIRPERMRRTLPLQITTVTAQVTQQLPLLHPTATRSLTALAGTPRSASCLRSSRISSIASAKLFRHSVFVRP